MVAIKGQTMADDFGSTLGRGSCGSVTVGGGAVSGDIEIDGDHDWFAVTLTSGTYYIFNQTIGTQIITNTATPLIA